MQNPYNRYQKSQTSKGTGKNKTKVKKQPKTRSAQRRSQKKPEDSGLSVGWIVSSLAGLLISFYAFAYTDDFVSLISRIQVGFSSSLAADGEDSAAGEEKNGLEKPDLPAGSITQPKTNADHLTMKNANVYKALKDKRRELEKKERRLAQLEEELQKQKVEIERQLKEMTDMRENISAKLDRKVAADQESIDKLVGVYANMKPKNAALILSSLNDELAVKVLGQMKKQNAAAILNFVAPKKAQYLSEKFSGIKQ